VQKTKGSVTFARVRASSCLCRCAHFDVFFHYLRLRRERCGKVSGLLSLPENALAPIATVTGYQHPMDAEG